MRSRDVRLSCILLLTWKRFSRTGQCMDFDDDKGSHHICIRMPSNFCTLTGQTDNWCTKPMNGLKVGQWCVCQWAFADYLEAAEAASNSKDEAASNLKKDKCSDGLVVCDATNMAAIRAYERKKGEKPSCVKHCSISSTRLCSSKERIRIIFGSLPRLSLRPAVVKTGGLAHAQCSSYTQTQPKPSLANV